jgi:hypothetical protein
LNGSRTAKVRRNFRYKERKAGSKARLPVLGRKDYFFSGVLAAGGAAGVALTLAFLSSVFFSSAFLSSFTGLAVGLATVDGLEVAAGEAATTGVEVGVVVTGLTVAAGSPHALPIAARAAKTVSRIDLLIVFSLCLSVAKRSFRDGRDRSDSRPREF